ncbi:MAG: DNA-directed RNA polymerase subunit omega [Deltaproteobacteria bacterium]|jgi:DNA-directed RNA polymerase subunit omega|nr:DNA-directed RNA polymerase subunit omega [Deltaproteobacteria bacterium]MBN2688340.1 DNA-directed RNA polymerase subunit omega [Deltaproteobacteria bacterium]
MARITVEDSLQTAQNRFALVLLTAQRTKQLLRGSQPLADRKENREIVTALREIAERKVVFSHPEYLRVADEGRTHGERPFEMLDHYDDGE